MAQCVLDEHVDELSDTQSWDMVGLRPIHKELVSCVMWLAGMRIFD